MASAVAGLPVTVETDEVGGTTVETVPVVLIGRTIRVASLVLPQLLPEYEGMSA